MIHTDTTGYRITCAVDTTMFTDLLVERPDHVDRLAAVEEALALWHGEALDEFRHEDWAAPEVARLDELRCLAIEDRAELLIARSRAAEAVASLEALVDRQPAARPATRPAHRRRWRAADARRKRCAPTRRTGPTSPRRRAPSRRLPSSRSSGGWRPAWNATAVAPREMETRSRSVRVDVPLPGTSWTGRP